MFSHVPLTLVALVGWLTLTLAAPVEAGNIEARGPLAQIVRTCTRPMTVALTFDDGPSTYVEEVDTALRAANAKGTFFLNGNNWGCIYSEDGARRAKFLYDRGHQVASHTWAHSDLSTLSRAQLISEFQRTDDAIRKITGATPAYMRPPYGKYNNLVLEVAAERGQTVTLWDFDSGDSTGASVAQQQRNYDDLVNRKPNTVISLAHDVHATSIRQVLPYAIRKLQSAGYSLVTLSECLGTSPYRSVQAPSNRDSSWRC